MPGKGGEKPCECCGAAIRQDDMTRPRDFARRRFCGPQCARSAVARWCSECGGRMKLNEQRTRWVCACGHEMRLRAGETPEQRAKRLAAKKRRHAQRREQYRARIVEAKAQPCMDCGGEWPSFVMHLHHVRGKKSFGIGQALSLAGVISPAMLEREIAKCDVVCANCHALRHGGNFLTPDQVSKRDSHNERQQAAWAAKSRLRQ